MQGQVRIQSCFYKGFSISLVVLQGLVGFGLIGYEIKWTPIP